VSSSSTAAPAAALIRSHAGVSAKGFAFDGGFPELLGEEQMTRLAATPWLVQMLAGSKRLRDDIAAVDGAADRQAALSRLKQSKPHFREFVDKVLEELDWNSPDAAAAAAVVAAAGGMSGLQSLAKDAASEMALLPTRSELEMTWDPLLVEGIDEEEEDDEGEEDGEEEEEEGPEDDNDDVDDNDDEDNDYEDDEEDADPAPILLNQYEKEERNKASLIEQMGGQTLSSFS